MYLSIFLVTLPTLSLLPAYAEHAGAFIIFDKDEYYLGETIVVSGILPEIYADYYTIVFVFSYIDETINITSHYTSFLNEHVFEHEFVIPDRFVTGEITLDVLDNPFSSPMFTFYYYDYPRPIDEPLEYTITTDKDEYYLGDEIRINGNGTNSGGSIITIQARNGYNFEMEEITFVNKVAFYNDGFTGVFTLSENTPTSYITLYLNTYDPLLFTPFHFQYYDYIRPVEVEDIETKKSSGSCSDCIPPTIGLNTNFKRIVDDGFVYNGNSVKVEKWHTPYPLINAIIGETNKVEIKVYENNGITNMKMVQFGMGLKEIGQPLSTIEVLIEVHLLSTSADGVSVEEIVIIDKDNLIDNDTVSAVVYPDVCQDTDLQQNCLKVNLEYSYRENTINNIVVVNVVDKKLNSQNFYFNDGIQVIGESLNEAPTYLLYNKKTNQQIDNLWLTLTRTDKVNHIWEDKYGIEYLKISNDRFERTTTPDIYTCDDPITQVMTRNNCHFREMSLLWK